VVSTAARGRRLGGGPALDGLFTGLVRAPELTGDSPPRHISRPTSFRANHCVPSSVRVCACLMRPHPSASSGAAFPIKSGSDLQIGDTQLVLSSNMEMWPSDGTSCRGRSTATYTSSARAADALRLGRHSPRLDQGQPPSESNELSQVDGTENVLSFPVDRQLRRRFEAAGN
jgi:hypothetical protein